jgi:cyclopropane fatty-acyl-phospholipid synthase-like methyltransferase
MRLRKPVQLDYNQEFYRDITDASIQSAKEVLGILYSCYQPKSVVDVGCGRGAWLQVAERLGSEKLVGFDGMWVESGSLLSNKIDFHTVDLERPVTVDGKYDLCISVEVAEHISQNRARPFIDMLCELSDVVLFSGAIPHQGGTHHVNEQWPSYWANMFWANGYIAFDVFRGRLWENGQVDWWFRQNAFLYVNSRCKIIDMSRLQRLEKKLLDVVHPQNYEGKIRGFKKAIQEPSLMFCLSLLRRYFAVKLGNLVAR